MNDKPRNRQNSDSRGPILEMNEFEEEAASTLDSAKKEASGIIERAKIRALEIVEQEKRTFSVTEKRFHQTVEEEVKKEKEGLALDTEKELKYLGDIKGERIGQAVNYILEKIFPQKGA